MQAVCFRLRSHRNMAAIWKLDILMRAVLGKEQNLGKLSLILVMSSPKYFWNISFVIALQSLWDNLFSCIFFYSKKRDHLVPEPWGCEPGVPGGAACAPEFADVVTLLFAFSITGEADKPTAPVYLHHLHRGICRCSGLLCIWENEY